MEIRTAAKTLPAEYFNSPDGVIAGNTFNPAIGVVYTVTKPICLEGVKLKIGQRVKPIIKNKRHLHYHVS